MSSRANTIADLIERAKVGPENLLHEFDHYLSLVNGQELDYVESIVTADPPISSLESYRDIVEKYDRLIKNIPLEYNKTDFINVFEIHKQDLLEQMVDMALRCKNIVLNKMIEDYQAESKAYV